MNADDNRRTEETGVALDSWVSADSAGLRAPRKIIDELRAALESGGCQISLPEQRERGAVGDAIAIAIESPAT